jgi:hypothetical protein
VSPVKDELGFISQKTAFFIVTAVIISSLTRKVSFLCLKWNPGRPAGSPSLYRLIPLAVKFVPVLN